MTRRSLVVVLSLLVLSVILGACGQQTGGGTTGGGGTGGEVQASPAAATQAGAATPAAQPAAVGELIFLSTQARPIEEAEKMRSQILSGFSGNVEFIPEENAPFEDRVASEAKAGQGSVSILGALHGDFASLAKAGYLQDLTPLLDELRERGFPEQFLELGKLGGQTQVYIPWMQATYIMAANQQALQYLPQGADINALTWEQLRDWGKNIQEATGEQKLGFPAGERGLMHRFLQGYLYPSYTGGMVTGFRSAEASQMWQVMQQTWQYVNPQAVAYEFMQEPLLSGEIWVAFDHTARLINAFRERPNDFVAFPAPAGPKGLGYMPVIAGLAIPTSAPNPDGARELIRYLTTPEVQIKTLQQIAFFPVVEAPLPEELDPGIRFEGQAVAAQSSAQNALPALLPVGLGEKNGEFNKVYRDTFDRIVIQGQEIQTVLQEEGDKLQQLLSDVGAPCWPPDPVSDGPCQLR